MISSKAFLFGRDGEFLQGREKSLFVYQYMTRGRDKDVETGKLTCREIQTETNVQIKVEVTVAEK